jgi:hypothetical protein
MGCSRRGSEVCWGVRQRPHFLIPHTVRLPTSGRFKQLNAHPASVITGIWSLGVGVNLPNVNDNMGTKLRHLSNRLGRPG